MFKQDCNMYVRLVFDSYSKYVNEDIERKTMTLAKKINAYSRNSKNRDLCVDLFDFIENKIFDLGRATYNMDYQFNKDVCYKNLTIGTDVITVAYKPSNNAEMLSEIYLSIYDMDDGSIRNMYLNKRIVDGIFDIDGTSLLLVR